MFCRFYSSGTNQIAFALKTGKGPEDSHAHLRERAYVCYKYTTSPIVYLVIIVYC